MISTEGLRPIVESMDRELSRLLRSGTESEGTKALLTSWATLVEFLGLGPPPDLRTCPFCGGIGMRAATLCGRCWRKLVPCAPSATE